jgi:hypothetical protein
MELEFHRNRERAGSHKVALSRANQAGAALFRVNYAAALTFQKRTARWAVATGTRS